MRPTFLTVLCILTFIGSGWGVINAITSYSSAEQTAAITEEAMDEAMDEIESSAEAEEIPDFISTILGSVSESLTPENIRNSSIASGIASLLCLIGAVLMWQLQRKGFYLYVIGIVVTVIAPVMVIGGTVGGFQAAGAGFIGAIFCVLYGLNLKHLS